MKKALLILLLLALLPAAFCFAQVTTESEFYPVDLMVVSIAPHPLGYKLIYYNSQAQLRELYIPLEWFQETVDPKAEIVYGTGVSYPYLTVVYRNGVPDHIRLHIFEAQGHPSWTTLSRQLDLTDEFNIPSVADLEIDF